MSKNNESPSTLTLMSDAIVSLAEKVSPSVVGVQAAARMMGGVGSGVIWSSDGHIVTCYHVVKGLREVQISSQELGTVPAEVVGKDPYSDLALLKVNTKNGKKRLQALELISDTEASLKAGQLVLALANPFGEQTSITQGIITSSRSSIRGWRGWGRTMMNDVVITDARLNPGYSGGPLVDVSGRMIGLNAFYISSRGVAIRSSKVKGIVENLKSYGRVRRAYLGITSYSTPIPEETAKQIGISQDSGLIVISVEPNSPAKKAGMLMGDVVLSLDGKQVASLHDIDRLLTQELIDKDVRLLVLRSEKLTELTIIPEDALKSPA